MLKKRSISWFDSEIDRVGFYCKPIYFNVAAFMLETKWLRVVNISSG